MYTREIQPHEASPVKDGTPLIGTWNRAFENVDLSEIRKPYAYSLPRSIINSRIKEWHYFSANDEDFFLAAHFFNLKLYKKAHIFFHNKKTDEYYIFKKVKPGAGWTLPGNLLNSSIEHEIKDSPFTRFNFCIRSMLEIDIVKLDFNIDTSRPNPMSADLLFDVSDREVTPMAVSLGIQRGNTYLRSMYAFKALAPVNGYIKIGDSHLNLNKDTCSGFFCDYKGFFPFHMQMAVCSAAGFNEDNKRFGFHIAENKTKEPYKNNENVLWLNGKPTPLPPVLITMPYGINGMWVIQDVEGMVDLTFTPNGQNKTGMHFLGYYNGMLLTQDSEQIPIKNLFGVGEKLILRV